MSAPEELWVASCGPWLAMYLTHKEAFDAAADAEDDHNGPASVDRYVRASPAPQAGVPMEALLEWIDRDMTYFDVDRSQPTNGPNVPVLAAVSKRIWYHATDSDAYPFSAVAKTTLGTARDAAPSADAGVREALVKRITAYLTGGGLFNPELANHDAVRNLLMDCRDALSPAAQQPTETKR